MELSILEPPLLSGWRIFPETGLSPLLVTFELRLTTLPLCVELLPFWRTEELELFCLTDDEEPFWRTVEPPLF